MRRPHVCVAASSGAAQLVSARRQKRLGSSEKQRDVAESAAAHDMRACAGLVQFARGSVWCFFVCRSCAASLAAAGRPTRGIPCGIGALFCACACNLALGGDGIAAFAQAVHLQHRSGSRAGSTFLSVYSSSPSIPLVTCRFGDAYQRRRYSTPPRRRQRVVLSASNAFLGADGSSPP